MKSKMDIVNAALVETGNGARQVENDGSCENLISNLNWCGIVEAELEDHHYSFARDCMFLTEKADPKFGFPSAYRLPDEVIIVREVFDPATGCCPPKCPTISYDDWEEADCILYVNDCRKPKQSCDPDGIWIDFTRVPPVDRWGKNFKLGVKYRLAAIFARGINEEEGVAAGYDAQADLYFRRARQRSSRRYNGGNRLRSKRGRLTSARMGGRHGAS